MSNKDDMFSSPVSPAAKKALEKSVNASTSKILQAQNNLDKKDITITDEIDQLTGRVNASINTIFAKLAPGSQSSADINSQTIDSMLSLARQQTKGAKRNNKLTQKATKELDALRDSVLDGNKMHLEQLLSLHKGKTMDSIATYNLIIKIIPKMRLALNTYATSILSPDDFTKSALTVSIDQTNMDQTEINRIKKRAEGLLNKFEINKHIRNDILTYLVTGKLYYLVTTVNKEIAKMLNEQHGSTNEGLYKTLSEGYLSTYTRQYLNESKNADSVENPFITEFKAAFFNESANPNDANALNSAAEELDKLIRDEFLIGDSRSLVADDPDSLMEGVDVANSLKFFAVNNADSGHASEMISSSGTTTNNKNTTSRVHENDIKGSNSAVVRRISSANIVPLTFNGKNFGYIHLDIVEIDPDNDILPVDGSTDQDGMGMLPTSSSAINNGNILQNIVSSSRDVNVDGNGRTGGVAGTKGYENPTGAPGLGGAEDARLMFMSKVFANRLSKETNLKLLKRNEPLRNAIYNGLAVKKLCSNQKLRIVYLKPEEVVFIDRGHSIFDNVLFFCKIYIATLITILMQNVLNGGDKRVVYVEVGEDNNGAHAVQQVIRDIKSREISSIMSMDIQSVLNIQSQFQDYYIPVVDGEKPISFETIDSQSNKNIDDEFLNWLGGHIFSGMGTPTAFLNEVENVDFAKMLSMQNSRYLRECLTEQSILSPGFTELARKIYDIEYSSNLSKRSKSKSTDEEEDLSIDELVTPNMLSVRLPPPAALALTTIVDQISNAQGAIDAIVTNSDFANDANLDETETEKVTTVIKAKLLRKLVPSMSWPEIDDIIKTSIAEYIETKIQSEITKDDVDETSEEESTDDSSDTDTDL